MIYIIFLWILNVFLTIFIHEFGHYYFAKLVKCKVLQFSIGFGKALCSFKDKEGTLFQITPYLWGGKVILKGEENYSSDKDSFSILPYNKKMQIVLIGGILNLILGLIVFILYKYQKYSYLYQISLMHTWTGILNLLPIPPLDGGFLITSFVREWYGEKIYKKINDIGMLFLKILIPIITIVILGIMAYINLVPIKIK